MSIFGHLQIAKELEAERAKVEEQVVATVRIATSLEARLQAAHAAKDAAEHLASVSERRAAEVSHTHRAYSIEHDG